MYERIDAGPMPAVAAGVGPFTIKTDDRYRTQIGELVDKHTNYFNAPRGYGVINRAIRAHEYGRLALYRKKIDTPSVRLQVQANGVNPQWLEAGLALLTDDYARRCEVTDIQDLPLYPSSCEYTKPAQAIRFFRNQIGKVAKGKAPQHLSNAEARFLRKQATRLRKDPEQLPSILQALQRRFGAEENATNASSLMKSLRYIDKARMSPESPWLPINFPSSFKGYQPKLNGNWGTMKINDLPKPYLFSPKGKKLRPQWRPGFIGPFRYPMRALLPAADGAAFGVRMKRKPGGSVLLDVSGSMDLSEQDIELLLEHAPGSLVAAYCGNRTTNVGTLYILAARDRMAKLPTHPGGNIIDGPALEWLGHQPEPRTWISDGVVSGVGDQEYYNCSDEAWDLVKKYKIQRYESIPDLLEGSSS